MAIIVGIKFKNMNKTYYFSPEGIDFAEDEGVIVETARGVEYGRVIIPNKEVDDKEIVPPLKPVIRKATEADERQREKAEGMKANAMKIATEKISRHNLGMKLVDAEYTFDCNKLVLYFTAAGRVDFRELVKELASTFRVRIELRQIYERADTKMRGALAACGRECCCATHLPDFEKVSIKMAKVQGLSLNPAKISGVCGRLMCCLKYENDYYNEMYRKMPKVGSRANTPDGEGVVESNDIIRQTVKVRIHQPDDTFEVKTYSLDDIKAKVHQNTADIDGPEDPALKDIE